MTKIFKTLTLTLIVMTLTISCHQESDIQPDEPIDNFQFANQIFSELNLISDRLRENQKDFRYTSSVKQIASQVMDEYFINSFDKSYSQELSRLTNGLTNARTQSDSEPTGYYREVNSK